MMMVLETFECGKWHPVLRSKNKPFLERVQIKLESTGWKCRIIEGENTNG